MMRRFLAGLFVIPVLFSCSNRKSFDYCIPEGIYRDIEFEMPKIAMPSFPDYTVNISDFGAVSDGQTLNTESINNAIEHVSNKGGGSVVVSRGIWLTGPIILKSNVNLHAKAGALIIFSGNFELYPIIETSFEGLNTFRCISPISAINVENIAITGEGFFDGAGDRWRPVKKSKITESDWKKLVASGGVLDEKKTTWYPSQKSLDGSKNSSMNVPRMKTKEEHEQIKDFLRPVMISLVKCKKILIDGVSFQNSPAWCLHPLICEDIVISNLRIKNPWYAQNGDGLDLESCKNAIIYNCIFDVGDDGICFKSGKDKDGLERGIPNENVIVKNCIVYRGHGGFVVGSETSGGMRNIHVSHCTFMGTDIGLRFKTTRGRGGVMEKIYISNIDMIDIPTEAIRFNMFYGGNSPIPEPEQEQEMKNLSSDTIPQVTRETPVFKDIFIKNIVCRGAKKAIILEGLPEMNLQNVLLENINISADMGMEAVDVKGVIIRNMKLSVKKGPLLQFNNSQDVSITGLKYNLQEEAIVIIKGQSSHQISLQNDDFKNPEKDIVIENGLSKEVVVFE